MASEIRVNQIQSRTGVSTISFTETGPIFAGVSTVQGSFTVDEDLNVGNNLNVTGLLTYDDVTNIDSVGVITARSGLKVTSGGIHVTGGNVGIGTAVPATKLNVVGNTRVEGFSNAKIQIKRTGNTVANGSIEFLGSDDSFGWGLIANYDAGGSNFNIKEGSNSRLYIKSGSIGIGTDNPDGKLAVVGNGYNQINIANNNTANTNKLGGVTSQNYVGDKWSIIQTYSPSGSNQIYYGSADGSYRGATSHYFYVNSSPTATSGHSEAMRIDSSGRVTTPTQPAALVYKTGTTQNFTSDGLVTYDATSYNQGGITIGGTRSRMTVPAAGKYMVNACTSGSCTTASAGDGWKLRILKNGTEYNHTYGFPIETTGSATGQELAYVVSMLVHCSASDYIEIQIENVGGATASMSYGYFGIYLVG